jgi:hypothetical protein
VQSINIVWFVSKWQEASVVPRLLIEKGDSCLEASEIFIAFENFANLKHRSTVYTLDKALNVLNGPSNPQA